MGKNTKQQPVFGRSFWECDQSCLVNGYIAMEYHHLSWVDQWFLWPFSSWRTVSLPKGTWIQPGDGQGECPQNIQKVGGIIPMAMYQQIFSILRWATLIQPNTTYVCVCIYIYIHIHMYNGLVGWVFMCMYIYISIYSRLSLFPCDDHHYYWLNFSVRCELRTFTPCYFNACRCFINLERVDISCQFPIMTGQIYPLVNVYITM